VCDSSLDKKTWYQLLVIVQPNKRPQRALTGILSSVK
jgi:hypothetical protein